MKSLASLTELSEEEERTRQSDFKKREKFINLKTAYQYLLQLCTSELETIDHSLIAEKVIIFERNNVA